MRCSRDSRANQAAAEDGIRKAARQGAKIVCLPELYRSLYFCQSEDHANFALAEPIPGPSTKALGALAKKLSPCRVKYELTKKGRALASTIRFDSRLASRGDQTARPLGRRIARRQQDRPLLRRPVRSGGRF